MLVSSTPELAFDLVKKHGANAIALLTGLDVAAMVETIRAAGEAPELQFLRTLAIFQLSENPGDAKSIPSGASGSLTLPLSDVAVEALSPFTKLDV